MSNLSIEIKNLSKQYRTGIISTGTLSQDLKSYWAKYRGIVDPNKKINENNSESFIENKNQYIWALKNIDLEVNHGEIIGIIGKNGAGKSTLLKILSRITSPTTGIVKMKGRVASMLEVGTGFHQELTGRENIFLNGAILGMSKNEIKSKIEEIIDFSGIENYIDTPVKRYSSGMTVRLAFSVAAHLDVEILLVDEVLAVGDIEFQNKCLNKINNITQTGRTVIIVSHNLGSINRLCNKGLLLNKGRIQFVGDIDKTINCYLEKHKSDNAIIDYSADKNKTIQIRKISLLDKNNNPSLEIDRMKKFMIVVHYELNIDTTGFYIAVMIDKLDRTPICHTIDSDYLNNNSDKKIIGLYESMVEIPGGILNAGSYNLRVSITKKNAAPFDYKEPFNFDLLDFGTFASIAGKNGGQRLGVIAPELIWKTNRIENNK